MSREKNTYGDVVVRPLWRI